MRSLRVVGFGSASLLNAGVLGRWRSVLMATPRRRYAADPPPPPSAAAAPPPPPPSAAAAPPPPPPSAAAAPPPPPPSAAAAPPPPPPSAAAAAHFTPYYFQQWQRAVLPSGDQLAAPDRVYVFGEKLGPRPVILLDQTTTGEEDEEDMKRLITKYERLCRSLLWEHGVVYIPLPRDAEELNNKEISTMMERSCRRVQAVMDMLDVRWTHFVGYSYGALVATRMACSPLSAASQTLPAREQQRREQRVRSDINSSSPGATGSTGYAHRIGSIVLLDTPLITEGMLKNYHRRKEILEAEEDVNVPEGMLRQAKEDLIKGLEPTLPTPATRDESLYANVLFRKEELFPRFSIDDVKGEGGTEKQQQGQEAPRGLYRDDDRYIPLQDLLDFSHPIDLILPAEQPIAEGSAFCSAFHVRKATVVKSATRQGSREQALTQSVLFDSLAGPTGDVVAAEMAKGLRNWMLRYEPDVYYQRQLTQAATEMKQLLNAEASGGGGGGAGAAGPGKQQKKKKKEGKKKKA